MQIPNKNIRESLSLAKELIGFADHGQAESKDDGCLLLYGLVRDCGYRIREEAEREKRVHRSRGVWDEGVERGDQARGRYLA